MLSPEAMTAVRAARDNQLQRTVNIWVGVGGGVNMTQTSITSEQFHRSRS